MSGCARRTYVRQLYSRILERWGVVSVLIEARLKSWRSLGFCQGTALGSVCESVDRIALQVRPIRVRIVLLYRTLQLVCEDTLLLFWRKAVWITILHVAIAIIWLLKMIMAFGNEYPDWVKEMWSAIDYYMKRWLGYSFQATLGCGPVMRFCTGHAARLTDVKLKSN